MKSDDEVVRLQLDAIRGRALRHSAAFAYRTSEVLGTAGSGTLFTIAQRYFVVTANHVIDRIVEEVEEGDYEYGLAGRDDRPGLGVAGNVVSSLNDPYDVAAIELTTPQAEAIGIEHFATTEDVAGLGFSTSRCLIGGSPAALDIAQDQSLESQFISLLVEAGPAPSGAVELDYPPHPVADLWLQHYSQGFDLDGNPSETVPLKGLSGAAIWGIGRILQSSTVEEAASQIKLVGLVKSVALDTFIRGTSWLMVAALLRTFDDSLASTVTVKDSSGQPHPSLRGLMPTKRNMP